MQHTNKRKISMSITKELYADYLATRKREQDLQQKKTKEKELFQQKQNDNITSNKVASDSVSFTKKHALSMSDALNQVRKSKVTLPDTTHLRPENN